MKDMLIGVAVLLGFLFMVTDYWLMTWLLLLFAVVAGTAEWSKRFRKP